MHEADQKKQPKIVYYPPKRSVIDRYARKVCWALAEKHDDDGFRRSEIVRDFADFIALACEIKAKHLTKQGKRLKKSNHQKKRNKAHDQ